MGPSPALLRRCIADLQRPNTRNNGIADDRLGDTCPESRGKLSVTDHHAFIDAHFERSNRQDVMYTLTTYSSNTQNCRVMTIRDVEMAGLAVGWSSRCQGPWAACCIASRATAGRVGQGFGPGLREQPPLAPLQRASSPQASATLRPELPAIATALWGRGVAGRLHPVFSCCDCDEKFPQ